MTDPEQPLRNWSDVNACPHCRREFNSVARIKDDGRYLALPCECKVTEDEYRKWLADPKPSAGMIRTA